jgi:viroplasmin and RNaseH domain-containing protein
MKYYAVRKGYKLGLTTSELEFEAQIDGYLNAEYDVFNTRAEAEKYLRKKSVKKAFKNKYRGSFLDVIKAKKNF